VTGDYDDALPLANITLTGLQSRPRSASVQCKGDEKKNNNQHGHDGPGGAKLMYGDGGVLFITHLESATRGGAWKQDLSIHLA